MRSALPWPLATALAWALTAAVRGAGADLTLTAEARAPGRTLEAAWRSVGGGTIAEARTAAWQDALRQCAAECGFTRVDFEDVFDLRLHDGRGNFAAVDEVLDRVVALNLHPALRLPAPAPGREAFLQHAAERYGQAEFRQWNLSPEALGPAARGEGPRLEGAGYRDSLVAAIDVLRWFLDREPTPGFPTRVADSLADPGADVPGLFHDGPGLLTQTGIVKPAFHAFRYLNALGEEVLASVPGGIVTRRRGSGRLIAVAFTGADARSLSLALTGLQPAGQILIERIDPEHGNAVQAWEAMGRPADPGRQALDSLRSSAHAGAVEYRQADDSGRFLDSRTLPPWSLLLLREL